MLAKMIVGLCLVVATLVVTTWFPGVPNNPAHAPIVYIVSNVDVDELSDGKVINPPLGRVLNNERLLFNRIERFDEVIENESLVTARQSVTKAQAIAELQGKFRLLETQYTILSVEDIAAIEASIGEIEDVQYLTNLSVALDELLYEGSIN